MASSDFGQLYSLPVQGQVYAQPLVASGVLLAATEHNQVYGFNPNTQEQLWTRNLGAPVPPLSGCNDISPEIGVTSTPVVDSTTGTMYVMSSVQRSGSPVGSANADFYLHALDVVTGAERANFPVKIQGVADNDPHVAFDGTWQLQRPGLLLMNGVVYAGFSGHCDDKPYEGWITGVSASSGRTTAMWTTEAAPGAIPADGPGGGIWMSGSGLVSDASGDIVFTTGNGTPPPTGPGTVDNGALGQAEVRLRVQADGTLKAVDHFAPYDASVLNQTDSDVGSGGVIALPPKYFGTPVHPRLLVTMGKQGYLWVTDAANLGGVGQGPLGSNSTVAEVGPVQGGVRGKPAVWGGDGGYVYLETSQSGAGTGRLIAYKYALDGNGNPTLNQAGVSADLFGFGSGSPIVTSDGTASGSALVWTVWFAPNSANPSQPGLGAQLRAYDAVPVNGQMVLERSFPISVGTKFAVPGVDGDRIYVPTNDGHIVAFGSPITAPLSGSTVTFPRTTVGTSSTATSTVTANSAVTVTAVTSNNAAFSVVSTTPALPATLATGATLQIQLKFTPTAAGGAAGVASFATSAGPWAQSLSATGQSAGPQLQQFPCCLSYGGVVVGRSSSQSVTFSNQGAAPLVINSYSLPSAPFTVTGLPPAGSSIPSGQSFSALFTFAPTSVGLFTDALELNTNDPQAVGFNGPNQSIAAGAVALSGTGGTQPVMSLTPKDLNYGSVPVGTTATHRFTVTNTGGTDLTITISKPPGGQGFTAVTSLPESTLIPAGQTVTERVDFTPTAAGAASDTWAITGDDGAGRQDITFHGSGVAAAPTVSIGDLDVNRPATGQTVASVPVTLSQATTSPVSMTYAAKDGSATVSGGDYLPTSGTLTFAPGETTKTIPVTINGATPAPAAETLSVTLGKIVGAISADTTAKLYLQTPYLPVSVSVDDTSTQVQTGGAQPTLTFPITVSPAPYPGQPITVNVSTVDGTAIAANGDYAAVNTDLTFTSSAPTRAMSVPLLKPPAAGGSKTVLLKLNSTSVGSNIADATATGTVYNGTAAPVPSLYVGDVAVLRPSTGDIGATFAVRLSPPTTTTRVPFTYTASAGSALTAADFAFTSGNLTFLPGETTKTVTVPIHGSATSTGTGTVNLNLSRQSGATLGDSGGKAYVVSPVSHNFISVRPVTAWRSPYEDTTVAVPITLTAPPASPVTITATTVDGTAVAGADYAASTSTLTIPAGATSTTLPVTILHNAAVGPPLNFSVKLSGASGATQVSSSTATVSIVSHTADTTIPPAVAAPAFTAGTPPQSAMVGTTYDYTFAATGSPTPSFQVANGTLPPGLQLDAITGELFGKPTTNGQFSFSIRATNTVGTPATTGPLTIAVSPAPTTPALK